MFGCSWQDSLKYILRPYWNYWLVDLKTGSENLDSNNFTTNDSESCANNPVVAENPEDVGIDVLVDNCFDKKFGG